MDKHLIWWIDDNDGREVEFADPMEKKVDSLSVEFDHPREATEGLSQEDFPDADLVLIDWMLNENGGYVGKGLTMAGTVREHLDDVPIYGFSSEALETWDSPATDDQFQDTLELRDLGTEETADRLIKDIEDYRTIEAARGKGFEKLLDILCPPEDERKSVGSLVPREFASGLKTDTSDEGGSCVEFGKWVRRRFLTTPGPLIDDNWAATQLGIKPDRLQKYEENLLEADSGNLCYEGIFSHTENRRWWASLLVSAIIELNTEGKPIRELKTSAPEILEVSNDDIAECSFCHEPYPDLVAAVIEGENANEPAHYQCSHVHHTREGSFEDYRIGDQSGI